jgi:hypothetical protein
MLVLKQQLKRPRIASRPDQVHPSVIIKCMYLYLVWMNREDTAFVFGFRSPTPDAAAC